MGSVGGWSVGRHVSSGSRPGPGRGAGASVGLILLVVMALVGCHGGRFDPRLSPASEDNVHRIAASGRLRVGMSGVQPPLSMKNRAGELVGLDVDLARALAEAMDLELELVETPFHELLSGLARGRFDLVISSLTITPARNTRVAFAGPYLISGAMLLTRDSLVDELAEIDALNSSERTFGALEGSTSADLIREAFPEAQLLLSPDLDSLVPRIVSGEIDGLIGDLPYVRFVLARHPEAGLAELPAPFTTEPLGIALPAHSPLLVNLVQNYLNALEYTGRLIQMKVRWLNGGDWLSEIP